VTVNIERQIACDNDYIPNEDSFMRWVLAVLESVKYKKDFKVELCIRIVTTKESEALNNKWRDKMGPTNVLSFSYDLPDHLDIKLLGDLVICAQVVENEAVKYNKSVIAHWLHMTVHGMFHLLGYDHSTDVEAEEMEAMETQVITNIGYPAPYLDRVDKKMCVMYKNLT